jgi:hypothetical protein
MSASKEPRVKFPRVKTRAESRAEGIAAKLQRRAEADAAKENK